MDRSLYRPMSCPCRMTSVRRARSFARSWENRHVLSYSPPDPIWRRKKVRDHLSLSIRGFPEMVGEGFQDGLVRSKATPPVLMASFSRLNAPTSPRQRLHRFSNGIWGSAVSYGACTERQRRIAKNRESLYCQACRMLSRVRDVRRPCLSAPLAAACITLTPSRSRS